jgi:hypothetical protein
LGSRAQIDLQFPDDGSVFGFRNLCQNIGDQIFLPALAEDHAIDHERAAQVVKPLHFATEGQSRYMAFNFCHTGEKPVGNKVVFPLWPARAPQLQDLFPNVRAWPKRALALNIKPEAKWLGTSVDSH